MGCSCCRRLRQHSQRRISASRPGRLAHHRRRLGRDALLDARPDQHQQRRGPEGRLDDAPRLGTRQQVSLEADPLVIDGVMYIPTGNDDIFALDAKTGQKIWE